MCVHGWMLRGSGSLGIKKKKKKKEKRRNCVYGGKDLTCMTTYGKVCHCHAKITDQHHSIM